MANACVNLLRLDWATITHAVQMLSVDLGSQIPGSEHASRSQGGVSAIENAELRTTELRTITAYVEALGGRLQIIADFRRSTPRLRRTGHRSRLIISKRPAVDPTDCRRLS